MRGYAVTARALAELGDADDEEPEYAALAACRPDCLALLGPASCPRLVLAVDCPSRGPGRGDGDAST